MTFENLRAFFIINLQSQDKNDQAFRDALAHLGYDPKTLVPKRARRYNISFHSRAIEERESPPLKVLVKEALDTKVDSDITRMLTMERGDVIERGDEYRV